MNKFLDGKIIDKTKLQEMKKQKITEHNLCSFFTVGVSDKQNSYSNNFLKSHASKLMTPESICLLVFSYASHKDGQGIRKNVAASMIVEYCPANLFLIIEQNTPSFLVGMRGYLTSGFQGIF